MRGAWAGRVALAVGLAGVLVPAMPGGAVGADDGNGITVTVVPASGLVDFQVVQVTATGFEPFSLHEIFECAADAVDESGCDADNSGSAEADANGEVHLGFIADARIFDASGREIDCRAEIPGCKLGVGLLAELPNSGFAPLGFDPDAPLAVVPTVDLDPATGLADQQVVSVHGAHLSSLFETFAYQCIAGRVRSSATCNFDQDVRAQAAEDGTITVDYRVDARLMPANGDAPFDCTTGPGACVIELSQGFSNRPDRFARAPISFATGTPSPTTAPPTSAPSTPTTGPPPGPPPNAPPATPVPGTPTFTG
jgi:hypothetical protein